MARHTDNHWLETIAVTGVPITSGGGGGTQYTEDAAAAANPVGNMGIARRKDTLSASEVSADGDNIALNATSKGELYVKQTDNITTNFEHAEDAVHVSGDVGVLALSVRSDTALASAGTAGDYQNLITDNSGRLWVRVAISDSLTPGTAAANLGKAEDAAHTTGDTGVFALGVRNDAAATAFSGTNGDYTPIGVTAQGEVLTAQGFSYSHIAAGQATTTVKSGAGILHSITFNSAATATNVTTLYDNTAGSGTVIAIPAATTATIPVTLHYDLAFATGLTIVTGTANGSDMTVSYR
jgi:hypothetical protein